MVSIGKYFETVGFDKAELLAGDAGSSFHFRKVCILRRAAATDAKTSGHPAVLNGRPPETFIPCLLKPLFLVFDHYHVVLCHAFIDCIGRYRIIHDHGLPFIRFPLGTDNRAS